MHFCCLFILLKNNIFIVVLFNWNKVANVRLFFLLHRVVKIKRIKPLKLQITFIFAGFQ